MGVLRWCAGDSAGAFVDGESRNRRTSGYKEGECFDLPGWRMMRNDEFFWFFVGWVGCFSPGSGGGRRWEGRDGEGIVGAPGGPCPTIWLRVGERGCEYVSPVWRDALFAMCGIQSIPRARRGQGLWRVRAKMRRTPRWRKGGMGVGKRTGDSLDKSIHSKGKGKSLLCDENKNCYEIVTFDVVKIMERMSRVPRLPEGKVSGDEFSGFPFTHENSSPVSGCLSCFAKRGIERCEEGGWLACIRSVFQRRTVCSDRIAKRSALSGGGGIFWP